MPSSQTTSYRKLLRRAQGAVRTLKTAGHSTMALEVELKRGEQAIAHKHWAEAKEHLDTVLASTPAVRPPGRAAPARGEAMPDDEPREAPQSFSDGERRQVADKLGLARDRLAILDQFGIATRDLLTSLQRADHLLDHGYTAQAETLADELLVMTKAAAEGLEAATHKTGVIARDRGGNGTTAHHDFLAALRGTLADLVKTQGWMGETEVRKLVSEAMGPLARAGEVETRLRQLAQQVDEAAAALRHDRTLDQEALAARLAELQERLAAGWSGALAELRQDLDQATRQAQEEAGQRARLAQAIAHLEQALDSQRDAAVRAEADLGARCDAAIAGLQDGMATDLTGLEQRCSRIEADRGGDQDRLRALAEAMAATQARIEALADHERGERARLAATLAEVDRQLQTLPAERDRERQRTDGSLHEHAQILIALESGLDGTRKDLAPLRADLTLLAQRLDEGLAALRGGLADRAGAAELHHLAEDVHQRLVALEQRLAGDEGRTDETATALQERLTGLAADLAGLQAASAGLATLGADLAQARSELAALRETAGDRDHLEAVTLRVQDQARQLASVEQDLGGRVDMLAIDTARTIAALDQAFATTRQEILARFDDLDARAIQRRTDEDAERQRVEGAIALLRRDCAALGAGKADTARLDELARRLEQTLAARERDDTERLAALGERLAQVDARADLVPADQLERTIADLRAELAAIADAKADHHEIAAPLAQLAALRQELDARLADLERRGDDAAGRTDLADVRRDLDHLATDLAEQAAQVDGSARSADLTALRDQLATATGRIQEDLAALAAAKADAPRLDELAATKADAARLDELAQRLETALGELRREDTERIAVLDQRIAQVDTRTDRVPAEALAGAIDGLRGEIATKADAARLDELAQRLETALVELRREDTERIAVLDQRIAQVDTRTDRVPAEALADAAAGLRREIAELAAAKADAPRLDELAATKADAARLDELAQRLEAALGDLRRENGERLTALDQRIAQVDTRADRVPAEALADAAAGLRREIAELAAAKADAPRLDELAATKADAARLDELAQRLEAALGDLRRENGERLTALDQRIAQVDTRTDPVPLQRADDALAALRTELASALAAKADGTRIDQMADALARLLASMREEMDTRLAATDRRADGAAAWQEPLGALAAELRTAIDERTTGKVDTVWFDQVEAGLDRRLVQQEESLVRIETALARRKTVDESTEQDAAIARLMAVEQEVASLGRDLLAKGRALDELRAAAVPEVRLAAVEAALAERATLAQAEDAAQRAATMVPELTARIDSVALDLADLRQQAHDTAGVAGLVDELKRELGGLRNLKEHVAETERRVADLTRLEERLAACETGLAATGAASATAQLPDRILQLITGSEEFRSLVAHEVALARNFTSPRGAETELVHRSISDLAERMEHLQEEEAPAFAAELATLRQKVDEIGARGGGAAVDARQLRDQVLESLRPLIPRSEKVVEVINAAVQAAVGRMQAPAAAAAPDPKALRKLLPDLLTAPEIRSIIISTVLLEALSNKGSLGNLTGIRQLVHDELLHIIADHKAHLSGARPPIAPPAGQHSGQRPATGH